jgi:hypothetical protein
MTATVHLIQIKATVYRRKRLESKQEHREGQVNHFIVHKSWDTVIMELFGGMIDEKQRKKERRHSDLLESVSVLPSLAAHSLELFGSARARTA